MSPQRAEVTWFPSPCLEDLCYLNTEIPIISTFQSFREY